jgi:protein CpxP
MKKLTTAVAIALFGATLAVAAPHEGGAGFGPGGRHGKRGGFDGKLAHELNLTDAQKAQIKEIRKASQEANKAFFEQSRTTMKAFHDARQAGDTAKLDALKPTLEAQRAQMKQIRDAEEARIAAVLTAEQNAKWQQLKARRGQRRGDRQ